MLSLSTICSWILLVKGLTAAASAASACGGYRDGLSAGQTFTLTSPNYPALYPRNQRCVWLFVASNGTGFRVNVTKASLEGSGNNSTGCKDYLQITDGSSTANQLAYLCQVSTPVQLSANRVYLWVKFQSDFQNQGVGFEMTVSTVVDSSAVSNKTPIISCNITRYTCPNKECIFQGSICDNVNDCGCDDYGCDETKCWKFTFLNDVSAVWGVGVGIGLTISISVFIVCGFLEMPERKRPECMRRSPAGQGCLAKCANRGNRIQQQAPEDAFMAMMRRMTTGKALQWDAPDSDSEASPRSSSRGGMSRRSSAFSAINNSSPSGSRRSSTVYAPVYGNTLSPKDLAPKSALSPAAAAPSAQATLKSPGPVTLTVPAVSSA